MATLVLDRWLVERIKEERALSGANRFDEVWEGLYVVAPPADDEHQGIQAKLANAFQLAFGFDSEVQIRTGVNVSDRDIGWQDNYRWPDVAVFMPDTRARVRDSHWVGGPDFVVEIISDCDRSRDKLPFYSAVGARELLLIDRSPWRMELYHHDGKQLVLVGRVAAADSGMLSSEVLALNFRFAPSAPTAARPALHVETSDGRSHWNV